MSNKGRKILNIRVDDATILELDRLAGDWARTRSGAARRIIEKFFEARTDTREAGETQHGGLFD